MMRNPEGFKSKESLCMREIDNKKRTKQQFIKRFENKNNVLTSFDNFNDVNERRNLFRSHFDCLLGNLNLIVSLNFIDEVHQTLQRRGEENRGTW